MIGTAVIAMILFYLNEKRLINNYNSKIQVMNTNIKISEALSAKENELNSLTLEYNKKNLLVDTLKSKRFDWPKQLDSIISVMPTSMSLVEINGDDKSIEIQGESKSNVDIATFLLNLHSFDYVQNVKPVSITNDSGSILKFTITMQLKAVYK